MNNQTGNFCSKTGNKTGNLNSGNTAIVRTGAEKRMADQVISLYSTLSSSEQHYVLEYISRVTPTMTISSTGSVSEDCLSRREKQVLILITHGYTRREIGASLNISLNTASRHIANIYRKLDVSTVAEAVRWAFAAGLAE